MISDALSEAVDLIEGYLDEMAHVYNPIRNRIDPVVAAMDELRRYLDSPPERNCEPFQPDVAQGARAGAVNDPDVDVLVRAARARAAVLSRLPPVWWHDAIDVELLLALAERLESLADETVATVESPYWLAFLERSRRG